MLLRRLGPAVVAALLVIGCAALKKSVKSGGAPVDRPQADARGAVSGLVRDFESESAEPFFQRFDQDQFTNWEDFRFNVRQFMLANRNITLDMVVDTVVADDEDLSVQTHWNRSYVSQSGQTKLDEGQCELVLGRAGSRMLVKAIHGQSPF